MISNIPIYRAKKIDSDEYVEGYYVDTVEFFTKTLRNENGYITKDGNFHIIDISTLAIHFPDTIDSQGNKVFASLQEDGKGGDICRIESEMENYVAEFTKEGLKFYEYLDNGKIVNSSYYKVFSIRDIKVVGIQE